MATDSPQTEPSQKSLEEAYEVEYGVGWNWKDGSVRDWIGNKVITDPMKRILRIALALDKARQDHPRVHREHGTDNLLVCLGEHPPTEGCVYERYAHPSPSQP